MKTWIHRYRRKSLLIPLLSVLLFAGLGVFPFFSAGEYRFFDLFMHLTPGPAEDERIVLLNIDDLAIARVGMFPWNRSVMADGLILMKEMGADSAVFDIEYTEESPMGLNGRFLREEVPAVVSETLGSIGSNAAGLVRALVRGDLPLEASEEYLAQLAGLQEEARRELLEALNAVARDSDAYLGTAAQFYETAYFTINMLDHREEEYSEELKGWVKDEFALPAAVKRDAVYPQIRDIRPTIGPIIKKGAGAGFTNINIDGDGVRRRIPLLARYEGLFFPQLSFQAVYDLLGEPAMELGPRHLLLKGARRPDGSTADLAIPLDPQGNLVINWPRAAFEESFRQISYYYLVLHGEQERRLISNLELMDEAGYLRAYQGELPLLRLYEQADTIRDSMLRSGEPYALEEYRRLRERFFQETAAFLLGGSGEGLLERIDGLLEDPAVSERQKESYRTIRASVADSFRQSAEIMQALAETRRILRDNLEGALCFIGWTGTATTDRGVNPFDETYDNVGTHAAVANTILQHDFLDVLPAWTGIAAALFIVLLYFRLEQNWRPAVSIALGIGFMAVIFGSALLLFYLTGNYFPVLVPLLATGTTFISLTIVTFLSTAREKTFIRNAFGQYLSNDVIDELLDNPEKLNLGGEKKNLTALFTDVKGFSSISEAMDPTDLVHLLNMYLTEMSDLIMAQQGTIDKFEGDAIISFFGAPAPLSDHAYRACLASVRMKRAEAIMNERIRAEGLSPAPLLTRIGINTGDMVVGNMGTAKKMDYTMMGNAVNLAARLEGVNKKYGTWLLISEATWEAGGKAFATRKLDRVRVVGINTPVRLYELVEEADHLEARRADLLGLFEEGLHRFEAREWRAAEELFRRVLQMDPEDGPGRFYLDRCRHYQEKEPSKNWDGVYNLTEK